MTIKQPLIENKKIINANNNNNNNNQSTIQTSKPIKKVTGIKSVLNKNISNYSRLTT